MRRLIVLLGGLLGSAGMAFPSAFAIHELGARASGMGGAFVAVADDPSTLFYNPAGIAHLKGTHMEMDLVLVNGQFRFIPENPPPGTAVPAKGFPGAVAQPYIPAGGMYATHGINDRVTVGFTVYAPHGLAANFTNFNDGDPANTKYTGRWAGSRAKLLQFWFQPTVGIKLNEQHAIGIGVAAVYTHIFLEQSILNPNDKPDDFGRSLAKDVFPGVDPNLAFASFSRLLPEGRLRAAASAWKVGVSAGYLYRTKNKNWSIGLNYRSAVVSHLKGDASFAFNNDGALTPFLPKDRNLYTLFPNQSITGVFTTPALYQAGVATRKFLGAIISGQVGLQQYDRFKDFPINFSQTKDSKGRDLATSPEKRLVFDFRNSWLINGGIEKPIPNGVGPGFMKKMMSNSAVRGGVVYDRSPVPDKSVGPLFPDSSRISWTAGMTKRVNDSDFTFYYQFMQFLNRTTSVPANAYQGTNGQYNNYANLIGLAMRFRIGEQAKKQ